MPTPTSPAKICAICKQDCTSKPRIKDAQGHYFCRECVEKKKAARAAGTPGSKPAPASKPAGRPATALATDDERGIMARLVEDSVSKSGSVCPGCRRPLKPEVVVCTQCGYNRQTAQVVTTQVLKPAEEKVKGKTGRRSSGALAAFLGTPMGVFVITLGLLLALVVAGISAPELKAVYVLAYVLLSTVVWIWGLIEAFRHGLVHGVLSLICGFYWLYFLLAVSDNGRLKALWGASALSCIIFLGVSAGLGADITSTEFLSK